MITQMTKYTLFCPISQCADIISSLQELGVIDITRSRKSIDSHSAALVDKASALKEEMSGKELKANLAGMAKNLTQLYKELDDASVWGDYDSSILEKLSEAGEKIHFHRISAKKFNASWAGDIPLAVIADDGKNVRFISVGDSGNTVSAISACEIDCPRRASEIRKDIEELEKEIEECKSELGKLPEKSLILRVQYDKVMNELDAYLASKASVIGEVCGEDSQASDLASVLDILVGYAPEDDRKRLTAALDAMPIYYFDEPATEDTTPIKLHNNWFARQFEVFTGMYGMPVYGEFDPTPILAPFFLLFFSMCMGDAGYGLLLMVISVILGRKMPQSGLGKLHNLILLLGVGTFVVGIFLGTFFGISLFECQWVPEWLKRCMIVEGNTGKIAGFDPQIVLSLGIGVFHICLAMIVKTACATARYGFRASLGTWGWTLLVVGGIICAGLGLGGILSGDALKWTVIAIAAISCIGIFPLNNPDRKPLANVGAGLWDSYNMATGLLGDTLSYIRLYALGLAGGMLGSAFNSVGGMLLGDNPTWQWVPFILIVVLGHALNLAMSCLGAFVHPLRLSFVEYFKNAGYEGRGRKYKPLSKETNN